uniref:Uncharacterized protein n=1 Tax=Gouania willdenowi TaxID=441366 RepID=A0A8C5GQ65_GOUWI
MLFRLPRLTPGYIRLLKTQAYHSVSAPPQHERSVPGMAMLLWAVGIGMCGYSSRQLALYHRPSARVLQWVGTHTDASAVGSLAPRLPVVEPTRWAGPHQEILPPTFVGSKIPMK